MSASAPACQFYSAEGSVFQPQFPMKHKEINTSSDIEYPSLKKARISTALPNPGVQVVLNEARTYNFKTQLCRRFRLGLCTLGSRCSYAHGIRELRRQDIVTKENPLAQTLGGDYRLCRNFFQGKQCSYGRNCRFLHARPDNINSRESTMINMVATAPVGHDKNESGRLEIKSVFNARFDAEVNRERVLLKTKLCNMWDIKGYCPFGKMCRFAHGQAETGKLDGYSSSEYRLMQSSATTANASTSTVATGPWNEKEPHGVNCRFKRNELQKISRIYADWI